MNDLSKYVFRNQNERYSLLCGDKKMFENALKYGIWSLLLGRVRARFDLVSYYMFTVVIIVIIYTWICGMQLLTYALNRMFFY